MSKLNWDSSAVPASRVKSEERRALGAAGAAHALNDGYTDMIYIMLPIWQNEFALSYAALGLLRSVVVGAMACLQIPAGIAAERFGAAGVLAAGSALAGAGFCFAGTSAGFAMLLVALFICGTGLSAQHPVASALVARAFAGPRSLKALGTYNFTGDLGKMTVPATLSLMLLLMPWRPALAILGGFGIAAAVAIYLLAPRYEAGAVVHPEAQNGPAREGRRDRRGFTLLTSIGIIDSATRMGFLLFLPFVLAGKGASEQTVGLALTLVFAGGAAGKLACTFIGARIGAIGTVWLTEGSTAVAILALLPLPLDAALALLPLIGVALNGTSSVLYGSVPDLVTPQWRQRALSVFYTGTIGSGALAPVLFGRLGDTIGISRALICIAAFVLLTLPLSALLRGSLRPR